LGLVLFDSQLMGMRTQIANLTNTISQTLAQKERLQAQLTEVESGINDIHEDISQVNLQLKNFISTQVILEPTIAEEGGLGLPTFLALGIVLGGVLGLIAAFAADFWLQNRDRIKQPDAEDEPLPATSFRSSSTVAANENPPTRIRGDLAGERRSGAE